MYKPKISDRKLEELVNFASGWEPREYPELSKNIRTLKSVEKALLPHIRDVDYFVNWIGRKKPKRYSRKSIIVDEYLIYVPYHYSIDDCGIYFRVGELWRDFQVFAGFVYNALENSRILWILADESDVQALKLRRLYKAPASLICSLFIEYIVFHYAHGVAHHVFEDLAYVLEAMGRGKYSLIMARDEEEYCRYVAFTTLEKYMPGVLARSRKAERLISIFYPMIPEFEWRRVESMNFATTKLLYVYYGTYKSDGIQPKISGRINEGINLMFKLLWKNHYTFEEDAIELKTKPLVQRIYLTRL